MSDHAGKLQDRPWGEAGPAGTPMSKREATIHRVNGLSAIVIAAATAGCAGLRPHFPPPEAAEPRIQIPGLPGVRTWGDAFSPAFQKDMIESIHQEERSGLFREGDTVSILAISGGGGDGAFGAGLLCGWTAAGQRPNFKLVTGISTGALTAPFAFLGPAYDAKLKKVYTTIGSKDVFKLKSLFGMLRSDAISLNDPLAKLTTEYIDEQVLKDIAAEQCQGPPALYRHHRPRRPAPGGLEHGRHRRLRPSGRPGPVPQGPDRLRRRTGHFSAGLS